MGGDGGAEAAGVGDALHDTGDVGGAVELAHLARHAHVLVDQRLVVGDHVLGRVGGAVLDGVGGAAEQVPPEGPVQELQQREDACGPCGWGSGRIAVQEEGQEAEPEGVSLRVESRMWGSAHQENYENHSSHPFSQYKKKRMKNK